MNAKLEILRRRMERQMPEKIPAPADDDLAAAIQRMIDQRVSEAIERQPAKQPAHVQRLLDQQFSKPAAPISDYRQLPAVPRAVQPKALEFQFGRDELGRINRVDVGGMQWYAQRNELGQITRMVPADLVPPPPAIEPPALAASRAYQLGEPR